MRTRLTIPALLLAMATIATAQVPYEVGQSTESNIDFYTSNHGIFGLNISGKQSGFIFPRGSSTSYLFGSGLWFGAKKQVNGETQKLTFITYNPNSGSSWAIPGEAVPPVSDTVIQGYPRLYHSTDYDHQTGEYDGPTVPPMTSAWPLWLYPNETAAPLHPGTFVLHSPDRRVGSTYSAPAFMPGVDEQFFSRFHDKSLNFYEIATNQAKQLGYPLGLQIQQNVYGWSSGQYSNVVVLQYDVINVSSDTLRDCAIAQVADPDIGLATNDHLGFYTAHPELRTSFVWSDSESVNYGTLAMTLLEGPVVDSQGYIDNSRRSEYRTDGRVATSPNWDISSDPVTPQERYDFMTSGTIDTNTAAGDRRTLLATGTFNMRPGDTAHYTFAFSVLSERPGKAADNGKNGHSLASANSKELETLISSLTTGYYSKFETINTSSTPIMVPQEQGQLNVMPNPATATATMQWSLASRSAITMEVLNSMGQKVMEKSLGTLDAGVYHENVDVTTLPAGVYIIVVRSDQGARAARLAVTR